VKSSGPDYSLSAPGAFSAGIRAGMQLTADLKSRSIVPQTIIQTGIWQLDYALGGGLRTGEVSVIGASTGHGKSALAEQIALYASTQVETTYFGLELGARTTETRMVAKIMHTDKRTVDGLIHSCPDNEKLLNAVQCLTFERKKLIVEQRDHDEEFFSTDMFKMMLANESKLYIIDHPRHLDDWHTNYLRESREQAAARVVRKICSAAKYLNAHIIVVSQLKSALQKSRPIMQDLADTYALAQSVDTVMLLHRPFRGKGWMDTVTEVILDKNRNGPEGITHVRWHGPHMKYSEMLPAEEAALTCCKSKRKRKDVEAGTMTRWGDD